MENNLEINSVQKKGWMGKVLVLVVALLLIGGGVWYFTMPKNDGPLVLSSEFIAKRDSAAMLLGKISDYSTVDFSTLVDLESKKDWSGAVNVVDTVINKNNQFRDKVNELIFSAGELSSLAGKLGNSEMRGLALKAVDSFKSGNDSLLKYFEARSEVFNTMKQFYSSLASGLTPTAPQLDAQNGAINTLAAEARTDYKAFNDELMELDAKVAPVVAK